MTRLWMPSHIDLKIGAQLKSLVTKPQPETKPFPFVTISRAFGCDGMDLAQYVIDQLNKKDPGWFLFRRRMLTSSEGIELTEERIRQLDDFGHSEIQGYIREALFGMPNQRETVERLVKITFLLAKAGKVVFLGGGATLLVKSLKNGVHIRLQAPLDWRVKNHQHRWRKRDSEFKGDAYQLVQDKTRDRESFIRTYLGQDISDPQHYDLIFNNEKVSAQLAGDVTVRLLELKGLI